MVKCYGEEEVDVQGLGEAGGTAVPTATREPSEGPTDHNEQQHSHLEVTLSEDTLTDWEKANDLTQTLVSEFTAWLYDRHEMPTLEGRWQNNVLVMREATRRRVGIREMLWIMLDDVIEAYVAEER